MKYVPRSHRIVQRRWFDSKVDLTDFEPAQAEALKKYGSWLEALASGEITPFTSAQRDFVDVAEGRRAATTELEKVWKKYCQAVAGQKRSRAELLTSLVFEGKLPYERLRQLADNAGWLQLSSETVAEIARQMKEKAPAPQMVVNALAVHSTTDGQ